MSTKSPTSKEEKAPLYTRLTPKQWAEIEALWESGEVTLADLVKRFGKNISTFKAHFKRHGIIRGSRKAAVKSAVATALEEEASVLAARIKETKEEHYKMASGLAKLAWSEILTAKASGSPVGVAMSNLKALDTAASIFKKVREERYAVLGLNEEKAMDDEGLPELIIKELTAEQIAELRDRNHSEIGDLPDDYSEIGEIELKDDDDEMDED